MAIKAVFKSGEKAVTVPGLYQWDYGQVLEIESVELPAANVEVHFSCDNIGILNRERSLIINFV